LFCSPRFGAHSPDFPDVVCCLIPRSWFWSGSCAPAEFFPRRGGRARGRQGPTPILHLAPCEVLHQFCSLRLALLSFTCTGGVRRQESARFFYPCPVQARACFLSGGLDIYFFAHAVIRLLASACPGLILESPDQRLELSEFSLYSYVGFSITHTRCLIKCV
jgi:hypothetical protein